VATSIRSVLSQANQWGVTRRMGKRLFSTMLYASFRSDRRPVIDLIQAVRKERALLIRVDEAYYLVNAVKSSAKVPGDLAEVGVYQGASSKLICEARAANRELHLFDTFEGLPTPGTDDVGFAEGEYQCSLESVRRYLSRYPNVRFYKGLFPSTAGAVAGRRFSFVNIDVDLYEGTRAALEFFYPRMSPGGILMSHDYGTQTGVRKAFDEFFVDKPEPLVELIGSQCMMVKLA
jgi:O-methyltransferase